MGLPKGIDGPEGKFNGQHSTDAQGEPTSPNTFFVRVRVSIIKYESKRDVEVSTYQRLFFKRVSHRVRVLGCKTRLIKMKDLYSLNLI